MSNNSIRYVVKVNDKHYIKESTRRTYNATSFDNSTIYDTYSRAEHAAHESVNLYPKHEIVKVNISEVK